MYVSVNLCKAISFHVKQVEYKYNTQKFIASTKRDSWVEKVLMFVLTLIDENTCMPLNVKSFGDKDNMK
jgi:hypothetical protein